VPRLSRFVLSLGLMVALPAVLSADLPRSERPEIVDPDRAKLRREIQATRLALEVAKIMRDRDIVSALQKELRDLEFAYAHRNPVTVRRP
jgi:hypothetical protein